MIPVLAKLLKKRGIQNVEQLSPEEKEQFDNWTATLSDGEISVEKIKNFCIGEVRKIETQWKDTGNSKDKNERLIILHTVYKQILNVIESPQAEREALEKYLQSLL